jgi:hypothetical protein
MPDKSELGAVLRDLRKARHLTMNRPDFLAASFFEEDVGHVQAVSYRAA